jgi:thiol-disulfide isomerase/thioredoxin
MTPLRLVPLALALVAALVLPGRVAADPVHEKSEKPIRVSKGAELKLEDYTVPGKTVIFDFYSDYCPPCRALSPMLEKLHAKRSDIVLVIVDINRPDIKGIDWKSPVARQYQLESIPNLKIFNAEGKLQAEGDPARELAMSWIEKLGD